MCTLQLVLSMWPWGARDRPRLAIGPVQACVHPCLCLGDWDRAHVRACMRACTCVCVCMQNWVPSVCMHVQTEAAQFTNGYQRLVGMVDNDDSSEAMIEQLRVCLMLAQSSSHQRLRVRPFPAALELELPFSASVSSWALMSACTTFPPRV